jgi:hypothetical protein
VLVARRPVGLVVVGLLLAPAVLGMLFLVLHFTLCVCLCLSSEGPKEVLVIPDSAARHNRGTHKTRQTNRKGALSNHVSIC